ncbi:MAG: hypothetical protein NVSMB57_04470 [Actinomycetota bacterium]
MTPPTTPERAATTSLPDPQLPGIGLLSHPKIRLLLVSAAGLVLLWFVPAAVWGAMPAWLVITAWLYRKAQGDDWLMLPIAGLPFWWATGLFQFVIPILAGISVIGAVLAPPVSRKVREAWDELGAEKWLALAAFAVMLPSVFAVTGGGRMFTYARTVGLIGSGLCAFLLVNIIIRKTDPRPLIDTLLVFAGLLGAWTLCQLVFKGSIYLPLQRTSTIMRALPGRAGFLTAREVSEIVGIKYEKIGANRLVVRPNVFFVHAVATGAIAGLFAPMLWRRIRHSPLTTAIVTALFSGLVGAAIVASLARGAYLGTGGALIAALIVFWARVRRIRWKKAAPSIALGLVVLASIVLPLFDNAKAREESTIGANSYSSRAAYYRATLKAIPDYLLFGHGTQRYNLAAPLHVGTTKITTLPDGTQEARSTWTSTKAGCNESTKCLLLFRKLKNGETDKLYYLPDGRLLKKDIETVDRDPPLGSHSTILGIGYKYGVLGMIAFIALWIFVGLKPLQLLRSSNHPLANDARALWVGILAFGLQLPIYEYDYDSTSPYLFYLVCGILLGMASIIARETSPNSNEKPARSGRQQRVG